MLRPRPAGDRGRFDHGWLDTRHTFSFAGYRDPDWTGFRALRVMNEDRVRAGAGFGTHPHRDMEILTLVLSGRLEHRDSLGNGAVLAPGEFQRMTAGTGLTHSEFNPSADEPVHFYQIWLLPDRNGLEPSWDQKAFAAADRTDRLLPVATPDGADGSLMVNADATVLWGTLTPGMIRSHDFAPGRHGWVQVLAGTVHLKAGDARRDLSAGDGVGLSDEPVVTLTAGDHGGDVLLFDLA